MSEELIIKSFSKEIARILAVADAIPEESHGIMSMDTLCKDAAKVIRTFQEAHKVQIDAQLEWHEALSKSQAQIKLGHERERVLREALARIAAGGGCRECGQNICANDIAHAALYEKEEK